MKKFLLTIVTVFALTNISYGCETPNGYRKYDNVQVCFSYHGYDTNYEKRMLYQSTSNPKKFCLCWADRIFEVIPANKKGRELGYSYMIWDTTLPIYFNID